MTAASLTLAGSEARAPGARRPAIEAARIIAVFGVVWFHIQAPGWRVAYGALGLFAILATVFAAEAVAERGRAAFLRTRLPRIARPWLAWSVFYFAVNAALLRDPVAALMPESPCAFLIGPALHLWFLPFLLIAFCLISVLEPLIRRGRCLACFLLIAIPVSIACFWAQTFVKPPVPFAQWAYGFPCVFYGLLSARAKQGGAGRLGELAPGILLVSVIAVSAALGATEDIGQFVLAAIVFEGVWRLAWRGDWMVAAGGYAFGVYLIHPFFILVYHKLFLGAGHTPEAALFVFALSFVATHVIKRTILLRRFV
jgi:surface polysaccharide O-acyltransferase-like enzyme